MPARPHVPRTFEDRLRHWAKFLALWKLCDNVACRRAQACRGNVRVCAPLHFNRAPQDVQHWFCAFVLCKEDGRTFDEFLEFVEKAGITEGLHAWRADPASPQ